APAAPELRLPRRHEPAAPARAAVAVTTLACLGSGRRRRLRDGEAGGRRLLNRSLQSDLDTCLAEEAFTQALVAHRHARGRPPTFNGRLDGTRPHVCPCNRRPVPARLPRSGAPVRSDPPQEEVQRMKRLA